MQTLKASTIFKREGVFLLDQKDKALWVHTLWDPLEKIEKNSLHSKGGCIRRGKIIYQFKSGFSKIKENHDKIKTR